MSGAQQPAPAQGSGPSGVTALLVAVVVVLLALTPFLFVVPASDDPGAIRTEGPVDAVVVLGGSPTARLDAATQLVQVLPDPPPTLVLAVQYPAPILDCGTVPGLTELPVACFSPEPATTSGEAVWIADEAAAQDWGRLVVVTSDYHVTRARVLVERCVARLSPATEVRYVTADTRIMSPRGIWSVATEWPSLLGTPWDHQPACR